MKNKVSLLALSILSSMSFNSLAAGDQAVNCGAKVVGTKSVYGGTAQCDAHYTVRTCKPISSDTTQLITTPKTITLTEQVEKHESSTINLSKHITYYESYGAGKGLCTEAVKVGERVRCTAQLDYIGEEDIKEHQCDYTPKAQINKHLVNAGNGQYQPGIAVVNFTISDRDGHVANSEAWINGNPVSTSSHHDLVTTGSSPFASTTYTVRLKVTDNDGYITDTSRNITVSNIKQCYGPGGQLILCDGGL